MQCARDAYMLMVELLELSRKCVWPLATCYFTLLQRRWCAHSATYEHSDTSLQGM
jgi:hypothetical protein